MHAASISWISFESASMTALEKFWKAASASAFTAASRLGSRRKPALSLSENVGFSMGMIHCGVRWNNSKLATLPASAEVIWMAVDPVPITPTRLSSSETE